MAAHLRGHGMTFEGLLDRRFPMLRYLVMHDEPWLLLMRLLSHLRFRGEEPETSAPGDFLFADHSTANLFSIDSNQQTKKAIATNPDRLPEKRIIFNGC